MKLFQKKADGSQDGLAINRISKKANAVLNTVFLLWALACVLPLILVVIVSFSSEQSIFENGYSFFPSEWSLDAYEFFFKLGDQLIRSYGITIFVTVVGTLFSLTITSMFAYVLSRKDYAYNRLFTLLMLFTMLFNGGIVATYMVNTQLLGLGNSIWSLILPMSLNAFYVIVLRTFYKSIPIEIIEAARIDGAGEFKTFFRIVLPLSGPVIAVIALYYAVGHWNSYFNALLYITSEDLQPLQLYLRKVLTLNNAQSLMQMGADEMARQAMRAETIKYSVIVVSSIPMLIMYPFVQRFFVKGVMIGAIKG